MEDRMEAMKTVDQRSESAPMHYARRRRLAPNVVCMFDEDRPPVVQQPRRGPYPKPVTSIRRWPWLDAGDTARFVLGKNTGKRVRIIERQIVFRGSFLKVESLDGLLWVHVGEGAPLTQSACANVFDDCMLRKISNGSRRR
jgi:hypothetical protein